MPKREKTVVIVVDHKDASREALVECVRLSGVEVAGVSSLAEAKDRAMTVGCHKMLCHKDTLGVRNIYNLETMEPIGVIDPLRALGSLRTIIEETGAMVAIYSGEGLPRMGSPLQREIAQAGVSVFFEVVKPDDVRAWVRTGELREEGNGRFWQIFN